MVGDDRNRSPELNNFGNLLFSLDSQQRALVRSLEKLYRKKIQSSFGVTFNQTCLDEYLLPRYTEIYIYIYICININMFIYIYKQIHFYISTVVAKFGELRSFNPCHSKLLAFLKLCYMRN